MSAARRILGVLLVLAVGSGLYAGAVGPARGTTSAPSHHRPAATRMTRMDQQGARPRPLLSNGEFVGIDRLVHPLAAQVVQGPDGTLFYGEDFNAACSDGAAFRRALRRLATLARIIEQSGRRVVYSVAPDKSTVEPDTVGTLPHGPCDSVGMGEDHQALGADHTRGFVSVVSALRRQPSAYWRTDAHWTTVGASVYAKAVARSLSPRLARLQHYASSTTTRLGDLEFLSSGTTVETAPAEVPDNGVVTGPVPGRPVFDPSLGTIESDNSWRSTPGRKTWPGRTLIIGDSFAYTALTPLRNLFRHGRFVWTGIVPTETIARAIAHAHTVVLEVVQRNLAVTPLVGPGFRAAVKSRLSGRS